ncbi:MAG TPA: hypothetical protein VHG91_16785 [Longimicrobium sp.]|nr:hypothetical protein [Longimicrobium sp.]
MSRRIARVAGLFAFVMVGGAMGARGAAAQGMDVAVMPYAGVLPFAGIAGGVQVEAARPGSARVYTLSYSRWVHGLICTGAIATDAEGEAYFPYDRCGEEGQTLLAGLTWRFGAPEARVRSYLGGGLGVAEAPQGPDGIQPAGSLEAGFDFWPSRVLGIRLGLRADGRFAVGYDYLGPVIGVRLSF